MGRRARRDVEARTAGGAALGIALAALLLFVWPRYWPVVAGAAAILVAARLAVAARRRRVRRSLAEVDALTGPAFEAFLARLFERLGFRVERVGAGGGDFGADLVLERDGVRVAVQAKNYHSARVGNDAVQQAIAGASYYGCERAMVVTNSTYTRAARLQAAGSSLPVVLWGRKDLGCVLDRVEL